MSQQFKLVLAKNTKWVLVVDLSKWNWINANQILSNRSQHNADDHFTLGKFKFNVFLSSFLLSCLLKCTIYLNVFNQEKKYWKDKNILLIFKYCLHSNQRYFNRTAHNLARAFFSKSKSFDRRTKTKTKYAHDMMRCVIHTYVFASTHSHIYLSTCIIGVSAFTRFHVNKKSCLNQERTFLMLHPCLP